MWPLEAGSLAGKWSVTPELTSFPAMTPCSTWNTTILAFPRAKECPKDEQCSTWNVFRAMFRVEHNRYLSLIVRSFVKFVPNASQTLLFARELPLSFPAPKYGIAIPQWTAVTCPYSSCALLRM